MEKLKMESPNVIQEHIKEIKKLFPDAVTEVKSGNAIKSVVDFTILEQELSDTVSGNLQERYQMTWPDKTQTFKNAYLPTSLTLRPLVSSSKNFEKTKNVYIEGDNLDALKILRETYLNKVKLVYVDPPYNTGNNLIYKNDFSQSEESFIENNGQNDQYGNRLFVNNDTNGRFHTDWLNMIYPRIKLARDFLTDDGFFVISIDQSELMNLIKVCDEIFGEENRINIVTVVHKPEGRNQEKFFGTSNEFALFYAKNKADANFRNVVLDQEVAKKFKDQDSLGNFRFQNFIRMTDGRLAYRSVRPKFWYPIYVNTTLKIMSVHKEKVPEPFETIFPITKVGVEMSWKLLPLSAEELINTNNLSFELDKSGFITIVEKIRE
jgi:adenine-specific DNA-methyltransferase